MNYIGIDISKISTGLCIEANGQTHLFNYTTKDLNYKWIKATSDSINFRHIKYEECDVYSESEILKLKQFLIFPYKSIN